MNESKIVSCDELLQLCEEFDTISIHNKVSLEKFVRRYSEIVIDICEGNIHESIKLLSGIGGAEADMISSELFRILSLREAEIMANASIHGERELSKRRSL
jgi:hypothetical protein